MLDRRLAAVVGCTIVAASSGTAEGAVRCGDVGRPFTDGTAAVTVQKGSLRCATARGLMRRYWSSSVSAFTRRVTVRHAGIRWTCRPTVDDFPYRWSCTGGGPSRTRFRVTARE